MTKIIPVILCGGSGTRLWPLSRTDYPKQFLRLTDEHSMLQKTALRALAVTASSPADLVVITHAAHLNHVRRHLDALDPKLTSHIITEPCSRNTAAAIALATNYCAEHFPPETLLMVFSADAHIEDESKLSNAVAIAKEEAAIGQIAIFGMEPTRAETGYGYILTDGAALTLGAFHVGEFIEKPTPEKAKIYVEDGRYLWNSGMFVFSIETMIREFEIHARSMLKTIKNFPARYDQIKSIPFDTAILERSSNVSVIPCDIGWSDIGSWQSLWDVLKKDTHGNYSRGNVKITQCQDNLIYASGKAIACAGLKNMLVVEMPDMIFIADKGNPQSIAQMAKLMAPFPAEDKMVAVI